MLLRNQGVLKVTLRGHALADEAVFSGQVGGLEEGMFVFLDEEVIPPGAYVMAVTGRGQNGWGRSRDGSLVYYAFWNRERPVWSRGSGTVHVLGVTHSKPGRLAWAGVG